MKVLTTMAAGALLLAVAAGACADEEEDVSTATPSPAEAGTPSPAETATPSPTETPTPTPTETPTSGGQIDFDTFLTGQNSGVVTEQTSVFKIENQNAWIEFWSTHVSVLVPAPTPPSVAFADKMLIAVFDREQATGGFAIEVQSIVVDESGIVVEVLRTVPGAGCAVTQAFTQPFHMVLADATNGDVQLVVMDRVSDC